MLPTTVVGEYYDSIMADPEHWEENRLFICDPATDEILDTFYDDEIVSIETVGSVLSENYMCIGSANVGKISVSLRRNGYSALQLSETIPRSAKLRPEVRVCAYDSYDAKITSNWIPQGHYFIDTRDAAAGTTRLGLYGYDAMEFANDGYPSSSEEWGSNTTAWTVVQEIATKIGVEIDNITRNIIIANNHLIQVPPASETMREVLGYIAVMYCGNFIMSKEGKLLLLTVNSLPKETFYLTDEKGNYITFGTGSNATRILIQSE